MENMDRRTFLKGGAGLAAGAALLGAAGCAPSTPAANDALASTAGSARSARARSRISDGARPERGISAAQAFHSAVSVRRDRRTSSAPSARRRPSIRVLSVSGIASG